MYPSAGRASRPSEGPEAGRHRRPEGDTSRRLPGSRRRRALAGATVLAMTAGIGFMTTGTASAAPVSISDASFTWGLNALSTSGEFAGPTNCNFLSAGTAGDNGSSAAWTASTPSPGFSAQVGNVSIEKPNASGGYAAPTFANKCTGPDGTTVLTTSTSSGTRVKFSNGTGTLDTSANTASIHWTGSFTSVYYGGLVYWSAVDPTMTVNADGTATLTATVSGYAASQSGGTWAPVSATSVTLANFTGITVTSTGFTVSPKYLGVAVTTPAGAGQATGGANFGAFPQNFVDFQQNTGLSSYWYSSGASRDAAKVASPVTVAYTVPTGPALAAPVVTTQPTNTTVAVGGTASFTAAASGNPTPTVQWQLQAGGPSWQNYPGATSNTFNLNVPSAGYNGAKVRAVYTNSEGTANSNEVTLTVGAAADTKSETITATVVEAPGEFSWTIDGSSTAVTLTNAVNQGSYLQSTSQLIPVKVSDTRAGSPAWSISGQVGDFTGNLSGKYLGWTPTVTAAGAGATAGAAVASGITSGNGLKDSSTLGSATVGHAKGTGSLGAALDLRVPVETAAGTYTATLTLTALS